MRAPEFWNHKYGREAAPFIRTALSPLAWLYGRATARRIATTTPYDPGIPVISVGNASVGGTGKTPVTAYLLESLNRMGIRAHGLSRGYGGREKGPIIVQAKHSYKDVGDEPLLLARYGPVWIAAGRDDGARAAAARDAQVIIMDDGHQNPLLKKTLSLLVVDAEIGFGNGRVFPAGPLREPIAAALSRTDAVILMKPEPEFETGADLMSLLKGLPVIAAHLVATAPLPKGKLFAFAGIGRPNKFFDALMRAGGEVVEGLRYANHYAYKDTDLKNLLELSKEYGAHLVTTEKDYVRIPKGFQKHITPWPVAVVFEDELTLRRILHPIVAAVTE
ncbi:MAG: tetraacyldisaccharide 4'-kinase [Robiginitomaculum sp.]|nr:MAG: tetraacyldisaccharide 4'-kinase [Robiginitomaculum sp.]